MVGALCVVDGVTDYFTAENIDHHVQVEEDAPHLGREIGDVPSPHLIGTLGLKGTWTWSWFGFLASQSMGEKLLATQQAVTGRW